MNYFDDYKRLTSLKEKIQFIDKIFDIKDTSEFHKLTEQLLYISNIEDNVILNHDIVFLIGYLNLRKPNNKSNEIADKLISQYNSTVSIVLKHEIVETLGNFNTLNSIAFLKEIINLNTEHTDIIETAKISITKINCYQHGFLCNAL